MGKKFIFLSALLAIFIIMPSCTTSSDQNEQTAENFSPESQLVKVKKELKDIKAVLAKEGEYNCCIQPTCNWCVLHDGDCECYDNLKAGKEVCPECGLGWHNGQGVVEGITASQVKWNITHEHPAGEHED